MSIANGTTHYDYPQVQLTDRPTFADFNPAFADIDAKLYGLITGAATDEQAIQDLGTAVGNLTNELGGVSETATSAKNKADTNEEAITLLSGQVSQNTTKLGTKVDSNAIAEPYDTSATYAVDDVVTYQGQRYKCITAVAVAEPFDATKWTGEDVETVLNHLQDEIDNIPTGSTAADVSLAPISGMSANNVQDGIAELYSDLPDEVYRTQEIVGTPTSVTTNVFFQTTHDVNVPTGYTIVGAFFKYLNSNYILLTCAPDNVTNKIRVAGMPQTDFSLSYKITVLFKKSE